MAKHAEHWLDLLAVRQSRGRLLKTVLAGAALTLPLAPQARSDTARTETNCLQPCEWTRAQRFNRRMDGCFNNYAASAGAGSLFFALPAIKVAALSVLACTELTILRNKAAAWDCHQPGCSGFDPKDSGGPCEGNNGPCCPCSGCDSGFMPCTFCCNKAGTGCGYGSDCGG
jgi:hypothetical protein